MKKLLYSYRCWHQLNQFYKRGQFTQSISFALRFKFKYDCIGVDCILKSAENLTLSRSKLHLFRLVFQPSFPGCLLALYYFVEFCVFAKPARSPATRGGKTRH